MNTAQKKLRNRIDKGFHISVGLDTDFKKIPEHLKSRKNPMLEFNKMIIDATIDFANSYKINFAFYESEGTKGLEVLEKTIEFIDKELFIIADAKRGDIGNTSGKYAESVFEYYNCDAVTLHPYMGFDSVEPFLNYKNKISFILALTSNPGSIDFEKQKLDNGKYLFQNVIAKINEWNINNNCGLVFGATNEKDLKLNIKSFKDMPVLLPGIGTQGGSLEDVVLTFKKHGKDNFIINISRGLIYTDSSKSFTLHVTEKLKEYNRIINELA